MNGFYANWNGEDFNQGGTTGEGIANPGITSPLDGSSLEFPFTSTISNVNGNAFDFDMTYKSVIIGGPFNGQTGNWHFIGRGTVDLVAGEQPTTDPGLTLVPNRFATVSGITPIDLSTLSLPLPGFDQDCIGGCWDWQVTGLTNPGDSVNVVIPLSTSIPVASVLADVFVVKLNTATGVWASFDTSQGDEIRTAKRVGGNCPPPGDALYQPGLTRDDDCVQLTVADGGLNDEDGLQDQVVTDPGGISGDTSGPRVVTDINDSSGCTLAAQSVTLSSRSDWALLAGFFVWVGWRQYKRKQLH
jgi:hypothetical protein